MAIVGIDLGTTFSLVAVWKDGEPQIIESVLRERLTPSVVGLDDDGQILIGQAAKERLITHPGLTAANFKRFMGTDRLTRMRQEGSVAAAVTGRHQVILTVHLLGDGASLLIPRLRINHVSLVRQHPRQIDESGGRYA